jgi:uncharacterized protein (DUF1919 family)
MKQQTARPSYDLKKIKKYIHKVFLKIYYLCKYFKNKEIKKLEPFTIISNNCIAGFLYQDYNIKYYSPTIGLQFPQNDFVKFCDNFEYYINCELEECNDKKQKIFTLLGGGKIDFPVGKIDDITIFFQHYQTFETAKEKWNERKTRINKERLFFIFVVYDNTPTEIIKAFEALPIKNKIIITNSDIFISSIAFSLHNRKNPWYEKMNNKIFPKKYYEQYNFYNWFINGIK